MRSKDICANSKTCSGCAACSNVCPKDAIQMKPDWRGFMIPSIDSSKCVDCGLCQKRCPANAPKRESFVFDVARVFVDGNEEYLTRASSGGAFGVLARYVLSKGGIVYGATMDENYDVYYTSAQSIDELQKLHGSKYVQAHVGMIYRDVKAELSKDRDVLFCGCPCQVAALNAYLGKKYENLITADLICHGVPSQPYFKSYVKDLLRQKQKSGITTFRFRATEKTCCKTRRTQYVGFYNKDYYMTYFLWGKGYRSSCYSCRYAGEKRPGDFTLADFWNNDKVKLPIDVSRGSSLVIFNTDKARKLVNVFENNGTSIPVFTIEDAVSADGGHLRHPSYSDVRTDLIYLLYKTFGLVGPKLLFKFNCIINDINGFIRK